MANHSRNIGPMQDAPRCGARTRSGMPCQSPAVSGKRRCRMHGGKGSGAPKGNRNALRRGLYTKAMLAREARIRDLCRRLRESIELIEIERQRRTLLHRRGDDSCMGRVK